VTAWNPAAERLFGIRANSAVGRDFFALPLGIKTDAAQAALTHLRGGSAADESEEIEFDVAQPDGPTRRAVLRFVRLVDGDSGLHGIIGLARPR
jgi:PAS domain-containing protein